MKQVSIGMKRYWKSVKEVKIIRHASSKPKAMFLIRVINQENKKTKSFAFGNQWEQDKVEKLLSKVINGEEAKKTNNYKAWDFVRFNTIEGKLAWLIHEQLEGLVKKEKVEEKGLRLVELK